MEDSIFKGLIELTGYGFVYFNYCKNPLFSLIIEIGSDVLTRVFTFGLDTLGNFCEYGWWYYSKLEYIKNIPYKEQDFKTRIKNNWD